MPQPDLPDAPVPDGDASTRADLRRAAKWAITGAVTSALMCASGVLAGERLSEQAVNPALLEEDLSEVVGRMAAACAVGGLLPGVVVAFLSGGGLRVGLLGGAFGLLAGGLGPLVVVALRGRVHPAVSVGLAGAAAGLLAGFGGAIWTRLPADEPADEAPSARMQLRRAAGWAITAALVGALAGATGALADERLSGRPVSPALLEEHLPEAVWLTAGACAGGGLLVGALIGSLSGGGRRVFGTRLGGGVRLGLLGGACGLLAGGLGPLAIVRLSNSVHPSIAFALVGAVVGLFGGLAGHLWTRKPRAPEAEFEEIEAEDESPGGPEPAAATRRVWERPMLRLLPVLAVAVLAVVAAIARVPPETPVVLLAVGLLGLAVAYALAAQERRIRELERRLREREGSPPGGTVPERVDISV